MNTRLCLRLAQQIELLLSQELGEGVDGLRMVTEPLYARDVLLVCDALGDPHAVLLAHQFREAAREAPPLEESPPAAVARPLQPSQPGGLYEPASEPPGDLPTDPPTYPPTFTPSETAALDSRPGGRRRPVGRRWFSPSRWLSGK